MIKLRIVKVDGLHYVQKRIERWEYKRPWLLPFLWFLPVSWIKEHIVEYRYQKHKTAYTGIDCDWSHSILNCLTGCKSYSVAKERIDAILKYHADKYGTHEVEVLWSNFEEQTGKSRESKEIFETISLMAIANNAHDYDEHERLFNQLLALQEANKIQ